MKNADLPAMPTYELNGQNVLQDTSYGLTKREYFAAHAPDAPSMFADLVPMNDEENKLTSDADSAGWAKYFARVQIEWRWYYADMMMESQEGEA